MADVYLDACFFIYLVGGIALDAASVYWAEAGVAVGRSAVMSLAIGGRTAVTLASGQNSPHGIAVDSTAAYWVNSVNGTVMKVPLAGGNAVTLASGQDQPYDVAVDSSHVYWTNYATPAP